MAIKVNGTTVIDDSRNLVNIASGAGSSTTYGDVGTYVFGHRYSSGITEGSTTAGSGITPAGFIRRFAGEIGADVGFASEHMNLDRGSSSLSGTWRAMSRAVSSGSLATNTHTRYVLWVRIS